MKRTIVSCIAAGCLSSAALASGLNVQVVTDTGAASTNVPAGAPTAVNYEVWGTLSDTANQGLALVGFDLTFTCETATPDPLPQAVPGPQMGGFVIPDGITNPAGYGGTTDVPGREGELVQVGGAQNTINNFEGNAPYPIGAVTTGLGLPPDGVLLATGAVNVPAIAIGETCTLAVSNIFANVISDPQPDNIDFWQVEEATPVSGENLTILGGDIPVAGLVAQDPPCRSSLWRTKLNTIRLTFDADLTAVPGPGELTIAPMQEGGALGTPLAGFTYAIENDGLGDPRVLRIDEPDPGVFTHQQWYRITNNGWADAADFDAILAVVVGDADANNSVTFTDVNQILSSNGQGVPPAPARRDIDGSATITFTDVNLALSRNGTGAAAEPTGHICTVP